MRFLTLLISLLVLAACHDIDQKGYFQFSGTATLGEIPPPPGCKRVDAGSASFGKWLRNIRLRRDPRVYLYNGSLKTNQFAQFAVLDIPVGKKDLQQCADAVMRLRADYLFSEKRFGEISFTDNAGKAYSWTENGQHGNFQHYLERVFGACGTASLEKQLNKVNDLRQLKAGDVFIKGGFPGHAMLVADVAGDEAGNKYFMLVQSYMPAQDIHVVRNPMDRHLSPWYRLSQTEPIITPEWAFYKTQLHEW